MKNFYITTPIYYSSGKPHIGHAYSTIMADVLSRYYQLLNYETFFLTGMDEHGQKIEDKAKENNLTPQAMIDENAIIFQELWSKIDVEPNHFIRTSDLQHKKFVQDTFKKLIEKKYIYKGTWNTMYCVSCEENIRESDIVFKDNQKYCVHGHSLIAKQEQSYFLKVTMFRDWLIEYYQANPNFIYPNTRVKELINNFLNEEFEDLSVTRMNVKWGIEFPDDKEHTIYVWMDALLNYLSALHINNKQSSFWNQATIKVHLLSKEITRFHCIYWPILLKMLDYPLPTIILSHGWIITKNKQTEQAEKMSKSLNNIIDPIEIIQNYNSDALRYFLMKSINVTSDSFFDDQVLLNVYNSDLANNFGNIISRTIGMLKKYSSGIVPKATSLTNPICLEFESEVKSISQKINEQIKSLDVNKITNAIDELANLINGFIEKSQPWSYFKENNVSDLQQFLILLYNTVKVYVFYLQPILVQASKLAIKQLNLKINGLEIKQLFEYQLNDDIVVNDSTPIFLRK